MTFWHKKKALTWPSELTLGKKVFINHLITINFTAEGRRIQ